ncbi:hypothetical protein [Mechercharimyces sp. CAU 1602]|uniref:hypothetical protein n=1 Tax=Mechercharimyces sp. CAU 1602 TaxID=2973933 RepID=UPI002163738F|nr:hypothetical protein [Mechercharimyces sp. CAU 1602]MCS1351937.1 hypothetical protein [Mechercharimyces sp. CAU 1602]
MIKKTAIAVVSLAMALSVFVGTEATYADGLYKIQKTGSGLDLRASSPTINGARSETNIPDGNYLYLYCYVNGQSYFGSTVWNWVDDNNYGGNWDYGYAPDYFIYTGTSQPVVEYCSF